MGGWLSRNRHLMMGVVAGVPVVITIVLAAVVGWNTTSIAVGVISGVLALSMALVAGIERMTALRS
ncbi:hypothetical protein A5786_03545 [Gordonia sp. 852002-50816_SCH5313054-a]|nr:hypothetical protein A5786_03545 [Gordonia sp. 852002-50816_SCH5313054-a]